MNRIASERKLKSLTQVELAELIGVDPTTIIRWEKGKAIPTDKLCEMRGVFECDLDWLLGLTNERMKTAG